MKLLRDVYENGNNYLNDFYNNSYKISRYVDYSDFTKVRSFDRKNIKYLELESDDFGEYTFNVYDSDKSEIYICHIGVDDKLKIHSLGCTCKEPHYSMACVHLFACFFYHSEIIFQKKPIDYEKFSKNLLTKYELLNNFKIQKEAKLEVKIFGKNYGDEDNCFDLKIDIGIDKSYALLAHFNNFINAYNNIIDECVFGTKFTYNTSDYFFNDINKNIIKVLNRYQQYISKKTYPSEMIVELLDLLKQNAFYFDNHKIDNIIEGFPLKSFIQKEDNKYIVDFMNAEFTPIGNKYEYVYTEGKIYHLSIKDQKLLHDLVKNKCDKIIIDSKKLDMFTKSILPIIKKNTVVKDDIKDKIVISNNTDCELYFDLNAKNVVVDVELIYDNKINYFDSKPGLVRDIEYENKVINDLVALGFIVNDKKIELNDIDKIVDFIDNGLGNISSKYKTFTTENFKKVNIKRKTGVSSHFGIGQDNILSYSFDLDGINSNELVNIFDSMHQSKKYYRLKNGDILNLLDNNLQELNNLVDDMEMTDDDIINGKGEILKYRAIYLDSLKDSKYHIIETDNLFTKFINNFKEYKSCDIDIPKKELKVLRDYQITGVKWLYNLDKTGFGGILADEMGLGKTIQVIYYIKQVLKDDNSSKILIVVPTSLLYNWEHEFNMFGGDINICIMAGIKSKREQLLKNESSVYITTYGILREDESMYQNIRFHSVIIDEAQNIKNYMSGVSKSVKNIKADTHIALTGTPIENSVLELWSIFDFIMPGYLSNVGKFQNKYRIKEFDEDSNITINNLSKLISPFILRRKKKDVMKELPEKFENNIFIELSDEQKKIYVAELEKVKKQIDEIIKSEGMNRLQFLILPLLTKLRQICIDPSIIYSDYNSSSNKIDTFINIIKESISNGHKILVFTSFLGALNKAQEKLEKEGILSYRIDGSVTSKERMNRVDQFNREDSKEKVFFIMLKAGGTGLNLATADVVIHLDLWWNPQAENQATDRAHRIGQKNVVEVIRIISKGTIEERILELQNKKRELSNKIIDGEMRDENILSKLNEDDIKNLLSFDNKD